MSQSYREVTRIVVDLQYTNNEERDLVPCQLGKRSVL